MITIPLPGHFPPPGVPAGDMELAGEIAKKLQKMFRDLLGNEKSTTKEKTDTDEQECKECKAKCDGSLSRLKLNPEKCEGLYQAHIASKYGMLDRSPFPTDKEWKAGGISFDALNDMRCILFDAKAQYAQFLQKNKRPNDPMEKFITTDSVKKAREQLTVIDTLQPGTTLQWHCMEYDWTSHLTGVFFSRKAKIKLPRAYFSVIYSPYSHPVCTKNYG